MYWLGCDGVFWSELTITDPHKRLTSKKVAIPPNDWALGSKKVKELIRIVSDAKTTSKGLMSRNRWFLKTLTAVLSGQCV